MSICIVDTSVFCELLRVPNMDKEHRAHTKAFKSKINRRESIILPMATIIETGNHIGQNGDGQQRRSAAERFVKTVKQAIEGESPFTPTPFMDQSTLIRWLDRFPQTAVQRIGLGDLSIQQEWERQRGLHPRRRVYVWSKDKHLAGYDTGSR